ncbi:hypothetical protein EUTSA_v10012274mg, partial [Eutrema salsugineum]
DHLFLKCHFSHEIWSWCSHRLLSPFIGFSSWDHFLDWLIFSQQNSSLAFLRLIAVQCIIYTLWQERNSRIFRGIRTPASGLIMILDRSIRNICSARRLSPKYQEALQLCIGINGESNRSSSSYNGQSRRKPDQTADLRPALTVVTKLYVPWLLK